MYYNVKTKLDKEVEEAYMLEAGKKHPILNCRIRTV